MANLVYADFRTGFMWSIPFPELSTDELILAEHKVRDRIGSEAFHSVAPSEMTALIRNANNNRK